MTTQKDSKKHQKSIKNGCPKCALLRCGSGGCKFMESLFFSFLSYVYIREIRIAKVRIFGTHLEPFLMLFWAIFGSSIFEPQNWQFLMGICHPKLVPKTGPKRVQNRDTEMPIQPVICVLKNGVRPVRGCPKWLKNVPKKEHFLDINNADLADVTMHSTA